MTAPITVLGRELQPIGREPGGLISWMAPVGQGRALVASLLPSGRWLVALCLLSPGWGPATLVHASGSTADRAAALAFAELARVEARAS